MDLQLVEDIKFLLSFVSCDEPADVPAGLMPMFYFTGTYEGDVELATRIADIKSRYIPAQNTSEEDTQGDK